MKCNTCNDPTKYSLGLWDGENGTHGQIFECHNLKCELKQSKVRDAEYLEGKKRLVVEENEKNMIFMELIKTKRIESGITNMKMSDRLGISPSVYCNYEQYREALPVEMVDKINAIFRMEAEIKKATAHTNSQINYSKAQMAQFGKIN